MVAVLVAHNGAAWLPRTLAAVTGQHRAPDEIVAVDAGSDDDSARLLGGVAATVVRARCTTPFLDAVRGALLARDAGRLSPCPPSGESTTAGHRAGEQEWVWLLHDDSAPAPDALARLLEAVERSPSVAVAGCKERAWAAPQRLLHAGFTTSRLGRPVTGVDPGDVDQGQSDDREDVLAVGTAGMLVRRDVWDTVAAAQAAPLVAGDDVALCRRVHLAGHRVVVVPSAVVEHAEASRSGRRRSTLAGRGWVRRARRDATFRRVADAPAALLPLTVLAVLLGAVARLVVRTVAHEPRRGVAELAAVLSVLGAPRALWQARRAEARTRVLPRRALRPLLAPARDVAWWHRDRWHRRRGGPPVPGPAPTAPEGRRSLVPALLVTGLAAAAVVAQHRLLGPGPVAGGALAPAPGSVGDLWEAARSTWVTAGLGEPALPHPFLATLSVLSLPFGSPALAVTALLLLAVPLAGLGAWVAAGAATTSTSLRVLAALGWAAAPPLLLALASGRVGTVVAHLVLPWLALAVARSVSAATRRASYRAAAGAALALAVAATAAPVLLPVGVAVLLVVALVSAPGSRRLVALVAAALPAVALAGPRLTAALDDPAVLVEGPGRRLAAQPAEAWELLLGQPAGSPSWPLPGAAVDLAPWAGVLLLIAAVVALVRGGPRGTVVRVGWVVVVAGLLASVAARAAPDGWAGAGASLVLLGLLAAVTAASDGAWTRARRWRRVALAGVAGTALVAPLLGLASWGWQTLEHGSGVSRGGAPVLPAVAVDAAESRDRTRTLVLQPGPDGVAAAVARSATERFDDLGAAPDAAAGGPGAADAADRQVAAAVAAVTAASDGARTRLADLGVGYVLLLDGPEGARPSAGVLDAVPGLARSGEVDAGVLWRVTPRTGSGPDAPDRAARVRVLDADGKPLAVVPSDEVSVTAVLDGGEPGRRLVLAERADAGWMATLDGVPLEPVVHDGWAQAFALPEHGGDLLVRHEDGAGQVWTWAQGLVVGIGVLVALPLAATRRRSR